MEGINEAALKAREREEAEYESRPIVGYCAHCYEPIRGKTERWEGDWYCEVDGDMIHLECIYDYFSKEAKEG